MNPERRASLLPIALEERADALPKISGHSAVFNSLSEDLGFYREIIRPGAFKNALSRSDVVCLANHNPDRLLAGQRNKTLTLTEDQRGLAMEAEPLDTQVARDTCEEIRSGLLNGQSFSFTVKTDSWRMEDGMELREILEFDTLYDVGPVVFPAYPATDAKVRALLEENGLDFAGLSAAFVKHFRGIDLTPGDKDIVKRASAMLLEGAKTERGSDIGEVAPQEWRNGLLRGHADLALISGLKTAS